MGNYPDAYNPRTAPDSAITPGRTLAAWTDQWAAIIRKGVAEAEARTKAKQRTAALPDEIVILDARGMELATVTPCDGGAMVKIEDPSGAWRETMFIQHDMIGRVGEALLKVARGDRT